MLIDLHCPVEPRGYEIKVDKKKELTSCTLTLFNLTENEIGSVEVQLKCYDSFGKPVGEPTTNEVTYHLQDLNAKAKSFFGDSKPIPLPDHPTTRTVGVIISRVKFADGEVWTKGDYQLYDVSTERLTGKALEELRTLVGEDAICYARQENDYWQCVCGRANQIKADKCIRCERLSATVLSLASSNNDIINELQKKYEQEKEEDEKAKKINLAKRNNFFKKTVRIGIPILSLTLMFIVALFIYENIIKPSNTYREAMSLMELGYYEEAILTFEGLGDFKDSSEMINEAKYLKAFSYLGREDFEAAINIFESLGDYKDSKKQVENAYSEFIEREYLLANEIYLEGSLEDAIKILEGLADYKNSIAIKRKAMYEFALEKASNQEYDDAIYLLNNVGSEPPYEEIELLIDAYELERKYINAVYAYKNRDGFPLMQFIALGDYKNSKVYVSKIENLFNRLAGTWVLEGDESSVLLFSDYTFQFGDRYGSAIYGFSEINENMYYFRYNLHYEFTVEFITPNKIKIIPDRNFIIIKGGFYNKQQG